MFSSRVKRWMDQVVLVTRSPSETQQNSILSVVQIRDNGCLVNDVAIQHGGFQRILTPNGVQLPLIMKNGLMYIKNYYPAAKQMREIDREEWMTAKTTCDPTKLDDIEGTAERLIKQFSPTSMYVTDSFYDAQGDVRATKSVLEVDPAVSNAQDKSSEKISDGYRPKPSEE